jgi:hypothetical protein
VPLQPRLKVLCAAGIILEIPLALNYVSKIYDRRGDRIRTYDFGARGATLWPDRSGLRSLKYLPAPRDFISFSFFVASERAENSSK